MPKVLTRDQIDGYRRDGFVFPVPVMAADKAAFGKFFHACLERGVYFAPSPYETGFLCMAHGADDIGRTIEVMGEALGV